MRKIEKTETQNEKRKGKPAKVSDYVHITVSLPFSLLAIFDEEVKKRGYTRSEAIRKAIRSMIEIWTGRRL